MMRSRYVPYGVPSTSVALDGRQVEELVPRAVDQRDHLDQDERDPPRREDRVERPRVEPPDDDELDHGAGGARDERRRGGPLGQNGIPWPRKLTSA